jgi:rubrerythrin
MPKFTRTKEDFACGHCGKLIKGNGYTNHCPHCLWSKHVDINPGDRQHICNGLMKPVEMDIEQGKYIIVHKCQNCGTVKRNKASPEDDFENILKLTPKAL